MTKNQEMYELLTKINMNKKMQQVHFAHQVENNFHYIRLYTGNCCLRTFFVGKAKDVIESLRAFEYGLSFDSTTYVK